MKRLLCVAAAGAALSGCVASGNYPPVPAAPQAISSAKLSAGAKPYKLNAREVSGVKEGVLRRLKDPYSAVFNGMRAVKKPNETGITVCGLVNAKNSFGGYTGDKLYMGLLVSHTTGNISLTHFSVTSIGDDVTEDMCKLYGVL